MDFAKRAHVIACCIRLHNFCVDRRLEIDAYLMQPEGDIEVQPGILERPPVLNREGQLTLHMDTCCTCSSCRDGSGRDTSTQADTTRRAALEAHIRDSGYIRPLRR
uniref:Uncharacterized protein n=1 Tax=Aureoumbra lagunensis TaxID=44058 RepID=A0A6S8DKP5_9STRA|mmetsp:Transcript_15048/g.19908  ORF Transcript_15048/g.19908 Transcript_15048/m.19908 type:complete len:106 (+) Transcript_15048:394-711(+)